jgi:hypothetical protein
MEDDNTPELWRGGSRVGFIFASPLESSNHGPAWEEEAPKDAVGSKAEILR